MSRTVLGIVIIIISAFFLLTLVTAVSVAVTRPPGFYQLVSTTPVCSGTTGVCTIPDSPRFGIMLLFVGGIIQKPVEDFTASMDGKTITPVAENVDMYRDTGMVKVVWYAK